MTAAIRVLNHAGLALVIAILAAACTPTEEMAPPPTDTPADLDWREIPLVDVRSGESFTASDFEGQVLIIDLMAVWCPNCLHQQQQLQIASANWDDDEVVIISLDVEPNETASILLRHMNDYNIAWRAAVAPQPMIERLVTEFGTIATTVTATPLIFIAPDGETELYGRGLKPSRVLQDLVAERQ